MKSCRIFNPILITVFIIFLSNASALLAGDSTQNKQDTLTQEQASVLAAKIANEKFKKDFGFSPFTAESYTAKLIDGKWHWGKISVLGINGCSAEVIFDKDGSNEEVRAALHTDAVFKGKAEKQKVPIDIRKLPDRK